jgi:hypothetical protein
LVGVWSDEHGFANLPLWLRFVLLIGFVGLVSGACLHAYRFDTRPVTLSVATSATGIMKKDQPKVATNPARPELVSLRVAPCRTAAPGKRSRDCAFGVSHSVLNKPNP